MRSVVHPSNRVCCVKFYCGQTADTLNCTSSAVISFIKHLSPDVNVCWIAPRQVLQSNKPSTSRSLSVVPHWAALFTSLQCVPIPCSHLSVQITSAANSKTPSRLQTSSLSQSAGLFWKSSLVIPCFLCVSSLKPVFRPFFDTSLSCLTLSGRSTQLLPSSASYLPSSRRSLPLCRLNMLRLRSFSRKLN